MDRLVRATVALTATRVCVPGAPDCIAIATSDLRSELQSDPKPGMKVEPSYSIAPADASHG